MPSFKINFFFLIFVLFVHPDGLQKKMFQFHPFFLWFVVKKNSWKSSIAKVIRNR